MAAQRPDNIYEFILKIPPSELLPGETAPDHYTLLGLPRFSNDAAALKDAAIARSTELRGWQTSNYFLWSEDDTRSENYKVRWGTSDSPLGPIRVPANNIVIAKDPSAGIFATGHNSVIQIPGKDEWYIVYHRRPLGDTGRDRVVGRVPQADPHRVGSVIHARNRRCERPSSTAARHRDAHRRTAAAGIRHRARLAHQPSLDARA